MKPPQAVVPSGCDTIDDNKDNTQIVVKFTLHSCIHSVPRLDAHPSSLAIRSFPGDWIATAWSICRRLCQSALQRAAMNTMLTGCDGMEAREVVPLAVP